VIKETCKLRPNYIKEVEIECDWERGEDYILEPLSKYHLPDMLTNYETNAVLVSNVTDSTLLLQKGDLIGLATKCNVTPIQENSNESTLSIKQIKIDEMIPEHLEELFNKSIEHLEESQQLEFKSLLIDFKDTFSVSDSDIGCFGAIKHTIDTGDARPIRQPMRRTPLGFEVPL
jgi:hypothetical protein